MGSVSLRILRYTIHGVGNECDSRGRERSFDAATSHHFVAGYGTQESVGNSESHPASTPYGTRKLAGTSVSHPASTPNGRRKSAGNSVSHSASPHFHERLDEGNLRPVHGREHYRVGTHQLFHKGEECAYHRI